MAQKIREITLESPIDNSACNIFMFLDVYDGRLTPGDQRTAQFPVWVPNAESIKKIIISIEY